MKAKYNMYTIIWTNETGTKFEADVSGRTANEAKKRFTEMFPEATIVEVK